MTLRLYTFRLLVIYSPPYWVFHPFFTSNFSKVQYNRSIIHVTQSENLPPRPFSLFESYRVHTSLTVCVSIDLSPLNPLILGDFERILFPCSPRIGG